MRDFAKFEKSIKVEFNDKDLLKKAFVHRSYINEHPSFKLGHNERLEFLGDAVLEIVVTKWLFNKYLDSEEGELTNWRASLVNSQIISEIAQEIGMGNYLYLSRGEAKDTNSKARQMILADAFEALIGSIYLDKGMEASRRFIKGTVIVKFDEILAKQLYLDPKSRLQEISQERENITPVYKVMSEKGPDHNKIFVIAVYLENRKIGSGKGSSKQEAQLKAAEDALTRIKS